jgi:hypothetical protein
MCALKRYPSASVPMGDASARTKTISNRRGEVRGPGAEARFATTRYAPPQPGMRRSARGPTSRRQQRSVLIAPSRRRR